MMGERQTKRKEKMTNGKRFFFLLRDEETSPNSSGTAEGGTVGQQRAALGQSGVKPQRG